MRFVLIASLVASNTSAADPPFPVWVTPTRTASGDHYCGLYCVHEAGRLTGHPVDLDRLIRPERLTGKYGSTIRDILDTCTEFGIHAEFTPAVSYADLYLLGGPAMILVKNQPGIGDPNHWMLVVRADANSAEVFDPAVGVVNLSAAELQSLWGGLTIAVYPDAEAKTTPIVWAAGRVVLLALVGSGTLLALGLLASRLSPIATLGGATLLAILAFQVVSPAGFARNAEVVGEIVQTGRPREVGNVSAAEAIRLRSDPNVVFVDARMRPQFERERVAGAVGIPLLSPYLQKKRAVAALPADAHVILFCESKDCPWARALGSGPLFRHFPRVSVLDGGLYDYQNAGGPTEAGQP